MGAATEASRGPSRRRFLKYAALVGASAWIPIHRIPSAVADDACTVPAGFPDGIELFRQAFENWAKEIVVDDVWTCVPRTGEDVVALANWARVSGYNLRARGRMHTWAPLTVVPGTNCDTDVVLVDTVSQFRRMCIVSHAGTDALRVQPGVVLESYLRRSGRAEIIQFPFTDVPWLKVWTVAERRPPTSRTVTGPCNYVFSDNLPEAVTDLIHEIITGNTAVTPLSVGRPDDQRWSSIIGELDALDPHRVFSNDFLDAFARG